MAAHQRPDEAAPHAVIPHVVAPHAVQHGVTPRGAAPDGPAGVLPRPSVQIPGARSDGSARPDGTARTLRHAIEHDQLTLHYQPKITAADGSVHGVEALVRWVHPQHGLRYPDAFLPQYGGYCAWAVANGYTAKGDPRNWKIVGGKLYLNYNDEIQSRWVKDIPGFIHKGDGNWPIVLDK